MRLPYPHVFLGILVAGAGLCLAAQSGSNDEKALSLPPMPHSPIEDFRKWLSQTPAEQKVSLASRSPEQRRSLISKLSEYQALSPTEREAKLQVLELRWYLRPLMEIPAAQRADSLSRIPDGYRSLVTERLRQWDSLPVDLQKDVLENEWTMHYFVRSNARSTQSGELLRNADPTQRKIVEQKISRWEALPPERRERMFQQFNQFFQLPETERAKTLDIMSESQRIEMEGTLKAFEKLPPAQRKVCIESFEKFTNMKPEERREFLQDAARWQAMSDKERTAWRNLVTALPPLPDVTPFPPMPKTLPPKPHIASNSPSSLRLR